MGISWYNRLVHRLWDIVSRTHPSECWRGYTRNLSSGQTHIHGQTRKVRVRAFLYLVIFALALVSIDMDVDLLVLACGTNSINEDLLRGSKIRRDLGIVPLASNRTCWCIVLPKGIGLFTSSVRLSLFFFD